MPRSPAPRIGRPARAGAAATIELRVRVTSAEHDAYSEAASGAGISLSEFVRLALDAALGRRKRKA